MFELRLLRIKPIDSIHVFLQLDIENTRAYNLYKFLSIFNNTSFGFIFHYNSFIMIIPKYILFNIFFLIQ